MEPKTDIPNPPEQNQAEPQKESFRTARASRGYWLSATVPLLSILFGYIVYYVWYRVNPMVEYYPVRNPGESGHRIRSMSST